ncbi:hypothetical protein EfsSVR2281_31980 [Enterococcus faecalis]|nr:hypothetical protein EfsSVR2281_31980 [Enterococcus faecalis]
MKIGFIGAGSMGGAIIKGLLKAEAVKKEHLYVKGGSSGTAEALQKEWGFQLVTDYALFQECKVIFIATGAKVVLPVLQELAPSFFQRKSIDFCCNRSYHRRSTNGPWQ